MKKKKKKHCLYNSSNIIVTPNFRANKQLRYSRYVRNNYIHYIRLVRKCCNSSSHIALLCYLYIIMRRHMHKHNNTSLCYNRMLAVLLRSRAAVAMHTIR